MYGIRLLNNIEWTLRCLLLPWKCFFLLDSSGFIHTIRKTDETFYMTLKKAIDNLFPSSYSNCGRLHSGRFSVFFSQKTKTKTKNITSQWFYLCFSIHSLRMFKFVLIGLDRICCWKEWKTIGDRYITSTLSNKWLQVLFSFYFACEIFFSLKSSPHRWKVTK